MVCPFKQKETNFRFKIILLAVYISQLLRDPLFEPVIIWESLLAKVNAVNEDILLVCEFIKLMGFGDRLL